jgi:hypothetical protein
LMKASSSTLRSAGIGPPCRKIVALSTATTVATTGAPTERTPTAGWLLRAPHEGRLLRASRTRVGYCVRPLDVLRPTVALRRRVGSRNGATAAAVAYSVWCSLQVRPARAVHLRVYVKRVAALATEPAAEVHRLLS